MVHIEGPRFLQEPPNWLDFTNSTGAIIDCKATGVPQPTISWLDAVDNRVTDIPGLRYYINYTYTILAGSITRSKIFDPEIWI